MTIKGFAAAFAASGVLFSTASAGEMADACKAALEAEGRDTSGCDCLEAEVSADAALAEEFQSLGEIADPTERYDAASDAAKAAMDKCTR